MPQCWHCKQFFRPKHWFQNTCDRCWAAIIKIIDGK